jgi:hypothetical protein
MKEGMEARDSTVEGYRKGEWRLGAEKLRQL